MSFLSKKQHRYIIFMGARGITAIDWRRKLLSSPPIHDVRFWNDPTTGGDKIQKFEIGKGHIINVYTYIYIYTYICILRHLVDSIEC